MITEAKPRTPPFSQEAEEFLISIALVDGPDVLSRCLKARLEAQSFYVPAHRTIYSQLLAMLGSGKPIDLATLTEELKSIGKMEECGGYPYLMQVSKRTDTTAQVDYFINKVIELSRLRQIIALSTGLVESVYSYSGEIEKTFTPDIAKLIGIVTGGDHKAEASWPDLIEEALAAAESIITHKGRPPAQIINFPWIEWDGLFQPMQRGQLVIPAGRTSTGKSCLTRQIAAHACEQGHKVYYVTLEVKPHQVPLQLAAMKSRIGLRQLHAESKSAQADFISILKDLAGWGIIVTSRDRSYTSITARARALGAAGKMDMFCVDYGGLVEEVQQAKRHDLSTEASRVMGGFKSIAMETNSVGVVPWQINRDAEKSENRQPRISDLRDCGQLENHADKILLIHRPDNFPNELGGHQQSDNDRVAERPAFFQNIAQGKGRDDGTSLVSMWFRRPIASFEPISRTDEVKQQQAEF
jgi:replicative DNA helicase